MDMNNKDSINANHAPGLDDLLSQAEDKFNRSVSMVSEWSDQARASVTAFDEWTTQARQILTDNPAIITGAIAIGGFVTGMLVRDRNLGVSSDTTSDSGLSSVPPLALFGVAAIAGIVLGPKVASTLLTTAHSGGVAPIPMSSKRTSSDAVGESIGSNRTVSGL